MGLKLNAKVKATKDGLYEASIPCIEASETMSNLQEALHWITEVGVEKFKDEFMKKNGVALKTVSVLETSFSVSVGLFLEVSDQSTLEDDYSVTFKGTDGKPDITMKGSTFERTPEILKKAQAIADREGVPLEDVLQRGIDKIVKNRKRTPKK